MVAVVKKSRQEYEWQKQLSTDREKLLTIGINRKVKKKIIKSVIESVFFVWIRDMVIKDGR